MRQLNEARSVPGEGVLIEEMKLCDEESHFRYFRMTRRSALLDWSYDRKEK